MATVFMRLSGFNTYRTLLAFLMLLVSTMAPLAHAKTGEMVHHAAIEDIATTDQVPEHGHGHDIEDPKDYRSNDSHQHNPADHSHDVPGISALSGQTSLDSYRNRQSISTTSQVDRALFDIDRPPRF